MSATEIRAIATTAFGLEAVVARELKQLGYPEQSVEDGRVTFATDLLGLCRANLWLRSADRVLVVVGRFEARDFDELFDQTRGLDWSQWLDAQAAFPVRAWAVRSVLMSPSDIQSVVKKAVVENLKDRHGGTWFEEKGTLYQIDVSILKDRVTIALDSSGAGLHKRGYRTQGGKAPLRENVAAALVLLSYWNAQRPFVDPFCGSGTIPIEAALIGRNIAPGLARLFASEAWGQIGKAIWSRAREQARDERRSAPRYKLRGSDIDSRALDLARVHAENAGVGDDIHFQSSDVGALQSKRSYGCVITNPPYGERLGDREQAQELYRKLARVMEPLDTWSTYVLAAHSRFESIYGKRAARRRKLYNGRIQCTYYQYPGPRPPRGEAAREDPQKQPDPQTLEDPKS